MSEYVDVSAMAANAMHSVLNSFSKAPALASVSPGSYATAPRPFGRQKSVHELLGGGRTADVLLWRDKTIAVALLAGSTILWYLLEHLKYSLVALIVHSLLVFIGVLFLWIHTASVLNRSGPPVIQLRLSEDFVLSRASVFRTKLNRCLQFATDIAVFKDLKLCIKVVGALWIVSKLGSWLHSLTLVWIVILAAQTLPVIYDQYEDVIDHYLRMAADEVHKHYKTIDATFLSKIPKAPDLSEKKMM
ncbi:hypothetical protein CY35_15G027300 [Sphagnum magellanicum]|nr:hypothetical protein CY35_15G027300 [Sphagnum magellanicum]